MAENEIVETQVPVESEVTVQPNPQEPSKATKIKAGIKEWFRKLVVKLKRKTQTIPLVVILITSLVYLCSTAIYAQVIEKNSGISNLGIAMFVNTLLSILVLAVFLNAFPKRKKPNIVFVVAVFVVLAIILGMDLLYLLSTKSFINAKDPFIQDIIYKEQPAIKRSYTMLYVHMAFVGFSILVFALLPLYKKGINKINTKKAVEENKLSGEIDTSAEV